MKVSHNPSDVFKSARNGGGYFRTPTFKFLPGKIETAIDLPSEIAEWTGAESPEITIMTTQMYTLYIEMNATVRFGEFTNFRLEVGGDCGNEQLNKDE